MAHGILDVATGERVLPVDPAQSASKRLWLRDNANAMCIISTSVEYSQLEYLITCTSAKAMWDKLSTIHERKSVSNKLMMLQKFHQIKMNPTDSVVHHVAKIQNMARQLADVGEVISEAAIMAKVLGSLPSKYGALITAWDSVSPEAQIMQTLKERLIKEEIRLSEDDTTASALAAMTLQGKKKPSDSTKKKKWSDVECFYCHRKGHSTNSCRMKKRHEKEKGQKSDPSSFAFITCAGGDKSLTLKSESVRESSVETGDRIPSSEQVNNFLSRETKEIWLTDSGASRHITFRREWLTEYHQSDGETVVLGDNSVCEVKGHGTVVAEKYINGAWVNCRIENVLHVPSMNKNLFSVGVCTNKGFEVRFKGQSVEILSDNTVIAQGVRQENDIYRMFFRVAIKNEANVVVNSARLWHERLGHINQQALRRMAEKGLIEGVKLSDVDTFFCEACQMGKLHRQPFAKKTPRITKLGEFFHSDVCGAITPPSLSGSRFFVIFKDDFSGFRTVYFLKHKSDVYERFKEFERIVANKFGKTMQTLKSDHGGEYCNGPMEKYLKEKGITMENSAPYTPQQNGKAERDNRTIMEYARSILYASKLPPYLWAEAVNTAVYLANRTTSHKDCTPYELWNGRKPDLSRAKVFDSEAFALIPGQLRTKLEVKAKKLIFVGYQGESTNYRLYNPETKVVSEHRNVQVNEKPSSNTSSTQSEVSIKLGNPQEEDAEIDDAEEDVLGEEEHVEQFEDAQGEAPDVGAGQIQLPQPGDNAMQLRDRNSIKLPKRYQVNLAECEPNTYQEATTGPNARHWVKAIEEELEAHEKNQTWKLVPRQEAREPIDSRWVFRILRGPSGEVRRYKARLCARGFRQVPGRDYFETYSPVVRYDSLRVFLAMVTQRDLEMIQFDIKTAFLYGKLEDEIYMELPEGLCRKGTGEPVVCKLDKALYGLKQSPRCWNQEFISFLKQFNFKEGNADKCILNGEVDGEKVFLALFVDDGLIATKNTSVLEKIVRALKDSFEITTGDASIFIGLQIERDRENKRMFLHQESYVKQIIQKFGMAEANTLSVPADPHTSLELASEESSSRSCVPYREAVGSLLFLCTVSRVDIAYAVNAASRFVEKHDESHWKAVKRIFRYLAGTIKFGIIYERDSLGFKLLGYSDADFAGDQTTRRSTTGYVFVLAGGPITWSSHRQKLVTLSTTEAEYVAGSEAAKELIWLRYLLKDIGYHCQSGSELFVDNLSAINITKNPELHKRTKHIDIKYHFIREKVSSKEITVKYVSTKLQMADFLTKALPKERFQENCAGLNLACELAKC